MKQVVSVNFERKSWICPWPQTLVVLLKLVSMELSHSTIFCMDFPSSKCGPILCHLELNKLSIKGQQIWTFFKLFFPYKKLMPSNHLTTNLVFTNVFLAFFSVWAVKKELQLLICPKHVLFLSLPVEKKIIINFL